MTGEICILRGVIAFYFPSRPSLIAAEDIPVAGSEIDTATLAQRIRQMAPTLPGGVHCSHSGGCDERRRVPQA